MALIRGFSKVDEDGKIAVPLNIRRFTGLTPEYPVEFAIMRVKDTSRRPHIYFFRSDHPPYLSLMEVTMMEGTTVINEEGKLVLDDSILEEAKLELGHLVEMKVAGSRGAHWLTLYNRVRYAPGYFPDGKKVMVKKQVIPLKEAEKKSPFRTMDLEY